MPTAAQPPHEPVAAGTLILVVDDDRAITRVLRSMLELEGYLVEDAATGVGLVDRVAAKPPDLILLDINMPELSGIEVLAALHQRLGDSVPVIMLSGQTENVALAVDTFRHGAVDYLVKPVAMDKLLATIRVALKLHRLRRERDDLARRLAARDLDLSRLELKAAETAARLERAERARDEAVRARESLAEVVSDGVLVVDEAGRVRQMSPAAARLAGKRGEDALGRPLGEVLGLAGLDGDHLAALAEGLGVEELAPGSGSPRVRLSARRHRLGESRGFVVALAAIGAGARGEESERADLVAALGACGWNLTRTAKRLKIGRTTLSRRMRSLGLRKPTA